MWWAPWRPRLRMTCSVCGTRARARGVTVGDVTWTFSDYLCRRCLRWFWRCYGRRGRTFYFSKYLGRILKQEVGS